LPADLPVAGALVSRTNYGLLLNTTAGLVEKRDIA
jgi:hypothetical protein